MCLGISGVLDLMEFVNKKINAVLPAFELFDKAEALIALSSILCMRMATNQGSCKLETPSHNK